MTNNHEYLTNILDLKTFIYILL